MVQYKKNNAVKRTKDNGMLLLAVLPFLVLAGCAGAAGESDVPVTADVTYDLNGGDGTELVDKYSPGDVVTLAAPTAAAPTDAEAFFGWSTSKDGFGQFYKVGSSFIITKDTRLYALWSGNGTNAAYPKLVSTADDLTNIGQTGYFALVDDVTMTAPVTASPFTGTFDGRGHTVTFNINTALSEGRSGLFIMLGDESTQAKIKNVHVTGSITVTGSAASIDIGGIAGNGYNAAITNCVSSVMISASHTERFYVGGIVGMVSGTGTTITNCYVSGSISTNVTGGSAEHAAGGIVGDIGFLGIATAATIQKTVSLADITWADHRLYTNTKHGARRIVGFKGTTGQVTGTIANNYALGTVTMTANTQPVSTQAANADYDGTAITTTDAADETWWKDIWSDVWGGNSPTPAKPWTWDVDAKQPKLYRVE